MTTKDKYKKDDAPFASEAMKKDDALLAPDPRPGEVDIAKPDQGKTASVGGGTGAAPDPGLTPDPNQDMARAEAQRTYERKVAAGENPGDPSPGPVAMSNQQRGVPQGPVAAGMKRVRMVSAAKTSSGTYAAGEVADISEEDAASLGKSVEPYEG